MKVIIKAIAPTVYQHSSLRAFGMDIKKHGNGSFSAQLEFGSEEEAKEYLEERARRYNDQDPEGSEERLKEMFSDIEHGALTLDAATARIEEVEEDDVEN